MDGYRSEEEQIEAIKQWWRENGLAVVLGAVVGIGGLIGWQSWQSYQARQAAESSALYDQAMAELPGRNRPNLSAIIDKLQSEYDSTPYAVLASLAAAKVAVAEGETDAVERNLQWVIDNAAQPAMVYTAKLRLARFYLAEEKWDSAEALANEQYPNAYSAAVNEMIGDLYMAEDKPQNAVLSYQEAMKADVAPQNRQAIQLKMEQAKVLSESSEQAETEPADA